MEQFPKWLGDLLGQNEGQIDCLLDDKSALQFLIAWSLFEAKCFNGFMQAKGIRDFAAQLVDEGIDTEQLGALAAHFHARYQDKRRLNNLLQDKVRPASFAPAFKKCLECDVEKLDSVELVFFLLVVVYRFRNNIFHGTKGIASWLKYRDQIHCCIHIMQLIVSHKEQTQPTMLTPGKAA